MSQANAEQLIAIEHEGGVLLSAGAGSGKTFVLIQHLIYLAQNEMAKHHGASLDELKLFVCKRFASIVLMTFTTKATGELKIRLRQESEKEGYSPLEREVFKEAFEEITISTIHGFCMRLISQGYITEIGPEIEIVSSLQFREKVRIIFERWLLTQNELEKSEGWFYDILSLNRNKILESLIEVFQTPELRSYWDEVNSDDMGELELVDFMAKYLELKDCEHPKNWRETFDLSLYREYEKNAWYSHLANYIALVDSLSFEHHEDIEKITSFFNSIKVLRGPAAKLGLEEVDRAYGHMKEIRDLFKKDLAESLMQYYEHQKGAIALWGETFKSAFDFIQNHYLDIEGFTFSDLEYYVYKSLKRPEVAERVAQTFNYFIVDEFQDTSMIQYQIILKSSLNNMNRIFCVGDVKQAIYGFRGGELGVFKDCERKIPRPLKLTNNYRSSSSVIYFNNYFFEKIFALGPQYEGEDHFSVEVVHQTVPLECKKGCIHHIKINLDLDPEQKPSNDDINLAESFGIFQQINALKAQGPNEAICILYKNLKPSQYLINLLIENQMSFTAQVKVTVPEEPIMGIFSLLLDRLCATQSFEVYDYVLSAYLGFLDVKNENITQIVETFCSSVKIRGLLNAFQVFVYDIGLANSNYKTNIQAIKDVLNLSGGELDRCRKNLQQFAQDDFSFEYAYGKNPENIIIMTAHGSKGLEFPHIIIGGIHTNGHYKEGDDLFGKLPGSFRWKKSAAQKKYFKSPYYLYEAALSKRKDFAESKRLFYVAATRAELSVSYIDIWQEDKPIYWQKNSWICGFREVFPDMIKNEQIEFVQTQLDYKVAHQSQTEDDEELAIQSVPLFHKDTLGILGREQSSLRLGLIPEMSVTAFSQIALCPRKFYLKSICKLNPMDDSTTWDNEDIENNNEEEIVVSSMSRGTKIHELISQALGRNFVIPLGETKNLGPKDRETIEWAVNDIKSNLESDDRLLSEELIKFPLFHYMITGTPDLVIQGRHIEIIDFKTGRVASEDQHYWTQLMAYAYAVSVLNKLDLDTKLKLTLMYVDQKTKKSKEMVFSEVESELFSLWELTNQLDRVNLEHCANCSFGNLCLPSGGGVAPH